MDDRETDAWAARLAGALEESTADELSGVGEAAVAFSGGLDSSVVALLVLRRLERTTLYTVGMPGARDLSRSREAAASFGPAVKHVPIELDEKDVVDAASAIRRLIPGCGPLETSFLMPAYIVFLRCRQTAVFTGDGADELFGGYHRYLSMDDQTLVSSLGADARRLLESGIARNRVLASSAGKELRTPFLSNNVVGLASRIPPEMKVRGGVRKLVLRRAAELLGLPPAISNAPKSAAQYGSSVAKVVRKYDAMQLGKG
jgi:asparagine synthase (glutamine-hydrolysing)